MRKALLLIKMQMQSKSQWRIVEANLLHYYLNVVTYVPKLPCGSEKRKDVVTVLLMLSS